MNSLGFDKEPKNTRVVVAMSGGVDSSVAAAYLKQQGYDVIGITLQLYDHGAAIARKGACCAGADIYDARCVAGKIGIPHYVLDYESRFTQSVMDDFADSYLKGETPIPCVRCNQRVKFRDLLQTARDLGADCLATGHYAQRVLTPSGAQLHAGDDPARDQSYFLFATTPEQLDYLRFPLGHLPKTEVRKMAEEFKLPVAVKPDSQDICFVPNGKYADVVARLRPGAIESGDIVDTAGNVLGRHDGIIHFTIGQRKGLNLQQRAGENREPLFVIGLNADRHQVVVGPHAALAQNELYLKELNWLDQNPTAPEQLLSGQTDAKSAERMAQKKNGIYKNIGVRFRSSMPAIAADIELLPDHAAIVRFHEPQFGIARGQACVIYDGQQLLGGGWITSPSAAMQPAQPACASVSAA